MWSLDRRACATLAVTALFSLAVIAPASTRAEERQSRRAQPVRTQPARAATAQRNYAQRNYAQHNYAQHEHPVAAYHRDLAARNRMGRSPAYGGGVRENQRAAFAVNQTRVARYGNSSTVERTIRPGFTSRTYMAGGRALYTRTYQSHVWHQYGRAFAYETFVPAVHYPAVYYSWALGVWARPVVFAWGWHAQPWYPAYGVLFTPYPVYMSPDQWMTDYIIAQNMQAAYQAQTAPPAAAPAPAEAPEASAPGWTVLTPTPTPDGPAYAAHSGDAPQSPQSADAPAGAQPGDAQAGDAPSEAPPAPQAAPPPAPMSAPPAVTPQIKAQLNAQIKVQLQERQAATATPATMTTMQSIPPALRPNHVFFAVVQPLEVPSGSPQGSCSLGPNDYIKRIGGMSSDDWMIPVVVELSAAADCPEGLHTRIGLNDLNAMENEQEAQVLEALEAASKRMGPNGPPHPALIADSGAAPAPLALDAVRQAQ